MSDIKIISLSQADPLKHGNKAANLGTLMNSGVQVPDGIVLSNKDAKAMLTDSNNQRELDQALRELHAPKIAIRSSGLKEDGAEQSYAGIFSSVLDIAPANLNEVLEGLKTVLASAESDHSKAYSKSAEKELGVIFQTLIDAKHSGVAFTNCIDLNGEEALLIEYVDNLGEALVSGRAKANRIIVPLKKGGASIFDLENIRFEDNSLNQKLDLQTIKSSHLLEEFSKVQETLGRSDIEWCIDKNQAAWILQARPITRPVLISPSSIFDNSIIASLGTATGFSFVIDENTQVSSIPTNSIIVAEVTESQHLPLMRQASGIITEEGGMLSHAAIICRELGIPCIVAAEGAKDKFPTGTPIQINSDGSVSSLTQTHYNKHSEEDIDYASLFCFENLEAENINGTKIFIDRYSKNPIIYAKEEPENYLEFEVELRKLFKSSPKKVYGNKFIWKEEFERFKLFPEFTKTLEEAKQIINNLDSKGIEEFYSERLEAIKNIVAQKNTDPKNNFYLDELLLSQHFLLNMVIPEGEGLLKMNQEIKPFLETQSMSFTEFLAPRNSDNIKEQDALKVFQFSQSLSKLRNNIFSELQAMNAMSYDYFDTRNDRAQKAMADCPKDTDPVDFFYQKLQTKS